MRIIILAIVVLISSPSILNAARGSITGVIQKVLVSGDNFGGCMVYLPVPANSSGLDCPGNWVSFSCTGHFNQKDFAYRMLDQAEASLHLGNELSVFIDDTKKHSNICTAYRVDIEIK